MEDIDGGGGGSRSGIRRGEVVEPTNVVPTMRLLVRITHTGTTWLVRTILFPRLTRVFPPCVVGTPSANLPDLPISELFISVEGDEFVLGTDNLLFKYCMNSNFLGRDTVGTSYADQPVIAKLLPSPQKFVLSASH